jgi:hypothetical protein
MRHQIGQMSPGLQAPSIRRALIAFLAAAYIVVGFAGEISCAEEYLIQPLLPIGASVASEKAEEGSKKTPTVVEHCYTCVPITMPAAAQVSEPVSVSVDLSFPSDAFVVVEVRLLDPPPPKTLT